mgnify:CR=1 FL=1
MNVPVRAAMQLIFEQIRVGGDRNFGYLLGDREARQAVLIDPSYTPDVLVQRAKDQGLTVTHIINTHGHADHTNGNAAAKTRWWRPSQSFWLGMGMTSSTSLATTTRSLAWGTWTWLRRRCGLGRHRGPSPIYSEPFDPMLCMCITRGR